MIEVVLCGFTHGSEKLFSVALTRKPNRGPNVSLVVKNVGAHQL